MHDYDNNTKLDGLEILKALTHLVPYEPEEKGGKDLGSSTEEKNRKLKEDELKYYMGEHSLFWLLRTCGGKTLNIHRPACIVGKLLSAFIKDML